MVVKVVRHVWAAGGPSRDLLAQLHHPGDAFTLVIGISSGCCVSGHSGSSCGMSAVVVADQAG